jgi:O-antigen/teichoic acid export membrane protein
MSARSPAASRFVGNTASLAAATVIATLLMLAQMKLLAAHLSLATFGLFASLRGLSLLVSIVAANGFPQVLVRYLPEHAARGARGAARRAGAIAVGSTAAACVALLAGVAALRHVLFRDLEPTADAALLGWFGLTTLAVALKLVLYGGFNGLRRFGSQTVLETAALAAQVAWMALERDSLTITRLFQITGVTSMLAVLVGLPWFALRLRTEVEARAQAGATGSWVRYWAGAVGLSAVALAFTDVDRWVLSHVLALESLSMFHVASRIMRLANRFLAVPVLAFQPEVTRVSAEGRAEAVALSTRAFFKASVLLAVFGAAAIVVYSRGLILLAANDAYLGARTTLWLLAASIPLSAMAAPLTAVMKAMDAVRGALYCDLAWAGVYVTLLLVLTSRIGLEGTGVAQVSASAVQLALAIRLASIRPGAVEMAGTLVKSLACAAVAFAPVVLLDRAHAPAPVTLAAGVVAVWLYVRLARRARVLSIAERERVHALVSGRGLRPALAWFVP